MCGEGRKSNEAELAAARIAQLRADPEAAKLLGRTRCVPAARDQFIVLVGSGGLPPLELKAHEQIQAQRRSTRGITQPNPLFEHARLHRFMREVFETVSYGKTSDANAALLLGDEGNAMLRPMR